MNKRVLIATLAGGVAAFLLGWLVMGILLKDYYAENCPAMQSMMKSEEEMMGTGLVFMFLSNCVMAYLFAIVFDRWANISTFTAGLLGGFLISLCVALSYDLSFYAMTNMFPNASMVIVDVLVSTGMGAVVGGIVAAVLGLFPRKAD